MRIAVNTRHLLRDRPEGVGTVTHEVMKRIVRDHPDDHYDYFFDRKFQPEFIHGPNVTGHSFFPPTRLPFLLRYWLNHPVAKNIKRLKDDVFLARMVLFR